MGESPQRESAPNAGELLDAVLAGGAPELSLLQLQNLPDGERRLILCTLCLMRPEIAGTCEERGREVEQVLLAACPRYAEQERSCVAL